MNESQIPEFSNSESDYVVIAGYGLPGRCLVETVSRQGVDYCVIELNPQTCERAAAGGVKIIAGDASNPEVLCKAGVERATLVALMVPDDRVVLAAVSLVRRVNASAHIIARCAFTSNGLECVRLGANESIIAEQLVARELQDRTANIFNAVRTGVSLE